MIHIEGVDGNPIEPQGEINTDDLSTYQAVLTNGTFLYRKIQKTDDKEMAMKLHEITQLAAERINEIQRQLQLQEQAKGRHTIDERKEEERQADAKEKAEQENEMERQI